MPNELEYTWRQSNNVLLVESTDPDAINKQLESMNDFYEPHKFVECTDDVIDFNPK